MYFRAATDYVGWWRSLLEHGAGRAEAGRDRRRLGRQPRAPRAHEDAVRRLVVAPPREVARLPGREHRVPLPGDGHRRAMALWITYLFGARAWSRRAGPRRGGAPRAHAARLLPRAPRVLRRADHGDVDPLRLRALARARDGGAWAGRSRRASSSGSRSRRSTTRGSCPPCSCRTRSSCSGARSCARCRAGRVSIPASLVSMAVLGPLVLRRALAVAVERHARAPPGVRSSST